MTVYINPVFQNLPSPEREKEAVTELELWAQDIATALSNISNSGNLDKMMKAVTVCNDMFHGSELLHYLEAIERYGKADTRSERDHKWIQIIILNDGTDEIFNTFGSVFPLSDLKELGAE